MPFETGREKTGGRTKGTPNKKTTELREKLIQFTSDNFDEIMNDLKQLKPKDRIQQFIKLMEFAIPKAKYLELENESDTNGLEREAILKRNLEEARAAREKSNPPTENSRA
jgi:hypothetical protein